MACFPKVLVVRPKTAPTADVGVAGTSAAEQIKATPMGVSVAYAADNLFLAWWRV
jgi:hypothetical protein